jgi:hypothetical protein
MEYQPGVCNIGRNERRKRRLAGILGFLGAAGVVAAVVVADLPTSYVLVALPFVAGGLVGLLQDYFGFCIGFAALARYDLSGSDGDAGQITDRDALRQDRQRAVAILSYSILLSVPITAVVYAAVATFA